MQNFLFVKNGHRYTKISFDDICYIESMNRYVKVVTTEKTYTVMSNLPHVAKMLPPDLFFRIHKSFIVSLLHTTDFDNEIVYMKKMEIPIGRQYRGILQKQVKVLCCENKPDKNESQSLRA